MIMNSIEISSVDKIPEVVDYLIENVLPQRKVWAFDAPMGGGKTTIIREICRQLKTIDTVTSPTFSIINEYRTTSGETIFHFDFYRLNNISEAFSIGIPDYFDSGSLCLIEWPKIVESLLPQEYGVISIQILDAERRLVSWTFE